MSGSSSIDDSQDWTDPALASVRGLPAMPLVRAHQPSAALTAAVLAGTIALGAVAGVVSLAAARSGLLVVALAAASTMLVRRVRRRGLVGRRVVLVGGHAEVSSYTSAGAAPDRVVGAVLSGPVEAVVRPLPFPTTTRLGFLPELVAEVDAEAVLVLPDADGTGSVLELAAHRVGARLASAVGDRIGAAALLLVTSPLLLLLWAAVRLETPGSGFHVSTRVGRNGRPFRMVSLRTMREDAGTVADVFAEQADDPVSGNVTFLIRRDPRVTRVGYWLRRWSLDELPRLLNVLRGEMPLGGPPPAHVAE